MPAVAQTLTCAGRARPRYPRLHDPDLAVARGAALYGEKKELERMVGADLRTRGRLRDGAALEDAAPADLDDACRRVADAYAVPLGQVRRAVEITVDTVVSRGFGVLAVNSCTGRLEPHLAGAPQRPAARPHQPLVRHRARRPGRRSSVTVVEQQGQAESERTEDAKVLIEGEISGIPPGYDEGSEVRVTFEMGFDGVLHVTAFHVEAGHPARADGDDRRHPVAGRGGQGAGPAAGNRGAVS